MGICNLIVIFCDKIPRRLESYIASNVNEPIISFQQLVNWQFIDLDFPFSKQNSKQNILNSLTQKLVSQALPLNQNKLSLAEISNTAKSQQYNHHHKNGHTPSSQSDGDNQNNS